MPQAMFECLCVCLQAVECYTQALSEAGGQSQRAACSALSCLQVSVLLTSSTAVILRRLGTSLGLHVCYDSAMTAKELCNVTVPLCICHLKKHSK